jgi:hypothetical protein
MLHIFNLASPDDDSSCSADSFRDNGGAASFGRFGRCDQAPVVLGEQRPGLRHVSAVNRSIRDGERVST